MRAMILAAGKGTRLRPLTNTVPKPLVEVAGGPMIAFALRLVRSAGIREVVINLHHLGEQLRKQLGDGESYGLRITYSDENPILDTGGAIAAARDFLGQDTFVVVNADTVIDLSLREVIDVHRRRGSTATMVLRAAPDAERYGIIEIDREQRVRRILGKPGDGPGQETWTPLMFTGVHVFDPRVFAYMPPGVYSITRDTYPLLLEADEPVHGYVHGGYWRVLDTPTDLERGRRELAGKGRAGWQREGP